ncbi:hypothetical protein M432DRAFT_640020 [Thermoascus aurantiacus ATCC 26904]
MARWIFLATTLLAVACLAACAPVAENDGEALWADSEKAWVSKRVDDGESAWTDKA